MKQSLPDEDYTHFHSNSGMKVVIWGPTGWKFLFTSILGSYPIKIDKSNIKHIDIKNGFRSMFFNLKYILPCVYCRESYDIFYKKIDIEEFLSGRIELMYWLYLIKDQINRKLIKQESVEYNTLKKNLKQDFYNKKISEKEYYNQIVEKKPQIKKTKSSPDFIEVLEMFEKCRADCSNKKTCK